ncbi:MAG: hypothetical protein QM703_28700 [Gemmatales bacterium]
MKLLCTVCLLSMTAQYAFAKQRGNPPPGGQGNAQPPVNATAQVNPFGQISQNPWFANPAIRANLNLTNDQFTRMNQTYAQYYGTYNKAITPFNNSTNLTDAQRQSIIDAQNRFYLDFGNSTASFISPEQQARLQQLSRQYRGYGVFADPSITERLRLDQEQRDRLTRYQQVYNTQLANYYRSLQTTPDPEGTRFNTIRQEMFNQINSAFNENQRVIWKELIGDPYNFPVR